MLIEVIHRVSKVNTTTERLREGVFDGTVHTDASGREYVYAKWNDAPRQGTVKQVLGKEGMFQTVTFMDMIPA